MDMLIDIDLPGSETQSYCNGRTAFAANLQQWSNLPKQNY